jgi:uncharacterized phage protein gp47/JayE
MAGVENTGFVLKRLPEILLELRQQGVNLFQDLIKPGEVVDTSDSSALGRLIALVSPSDADLWEAAQEVYAAFDPNAATGIALDNLVDYAGITRIEQTFTTTSLLLAGDINTFITAGSVVGSDITGDNFTTVSGVGLTPDFASGITISVLTVANSTAYSFTYAGNTSTQTVSITSSASATVANILSALQAQIASAHPTLSASVVGETLIVNRVDLFQRVTFTVSPNLGVTKVRKIGEAVAEDAGPLPQQANTITKIVTPILGWDSVTNPIAATEGQLRETDEELRLRFRNSKFERATNTLDAMYSALQGVEGVEQVIIYENDTNVTDGNGVPAKSFLPIIVGGLSLDIANAIWDNKPVGILSFGNTTVNIDDIQGFPHAVSFQRPEPVVIYITMDLTTDSLFPGNGIDQIKAELISYFESNIGVGQDVVYSRLFTPINKVAGHQVNSLTIAKTPSPVGTSNIVIDFDEIASLSNVNIIITT